MDDLPPIQPFKERLVQLDAAMQAPNFFSDQRKAAAIAREHQKVSDAIALYQALAQCIRAAEDNQTLLADASLDAELRTLAEQDLEVQQAEVERLRQAILVAMIEPDPLDSRNTVLEIRAGAGGGEASLFVAELYRMYLRFAEGQGWRVESLGCSPSDCGGFKEVSFLITGNDVYKSLKLESGVHRVQRVPATEANGRIHTSTVTVAVLPEAEEVDIKIDPSELEITVSRASGPGGQGVNTTDSAVQILHKPTGMIVNCADERSQQKNRVKAMTVLRSRLLQKKEEEERAKYAATRRSQIGSGDRSERIRTYNFPQSRLTDHRIGFTSHNLSGILEGKIEEVIQALWHADQRLKVAKLMGQELSLTSHANDSDD
jgi:peptide chain release factor 1